MTIPRTSGARHAPLLSYTVLRDFHGYGMFLAIGAAIKKVTYLIEETGVAPVENMNVNNYVF